jgi:hypothetical protein
VAAFLIVAMHLHWPWWLAALIATVVVVTVLLLASKWERWRFDR